MKKPVVFVIMPFDEDYLELYEELKNSFIDGYEFINAGDLDNQQNILRDIVVGIAKSDIIIADLTGLNPNVFYELGLAHAMNKKVIIITQSIEDLPFDIKSYRACEYSMKFYKIRKFKEDLKKHLDGAVDGSMEFGNPVSDFATDYLMNNVGKNNEDLNVKNDNQQNDIVIDEEKGFIDFFVDIQNNMNLISEELENVSEDMDDMSRSVNKTSKQYDVVKEKSGSVDASYTRKMCKKIATDIEKFADKFDGRICKVSDLWENVENDYLLLLDNPYIKDKDNIDSINSSKESLLGLIDSLEKNEQEVESLIYEVNRNKGIERKLNSAINKLSNGLEKFISMIETMKSTINRIEIKSDTIIEIIKGQQI